MKSKAQINGNLTSFKAVNAFIFAGSFSLGTIEAGFDLQKVLEIADDQPEKNAFYFIKNVEDVPVVLPSEWENDAWLDALREEKIDLMCCNCPCSSLSQINRNASVDGKNNVHFYRLFNAFTHVQPKVFIIENAPTLIKLGYPILKDMASKLGNIYKFTVVRDIAGNHEVPMMRQRTLVFGWRNDVFKKIPIIKQDKRLMVVVKDTLAGLEECTTNNFKSPTMDKISSLYKYAIPGCALMTSLAMKYMEDSNGFASMLEKKLDGTSYLREVKRIASKMQAKKNFWDKSPYKLLDDERFPSFTSVTEYLHPHQDRMLNLTEMARIMNYPDWYSFEDEGHACKIPVSQAMAQGVPVNFGKYAAMQARLALEGKLSSIERDDAVMAFQHHSQHKVSAFTLDEVNEMKELDVKHDAQELKD